MINAGLDEDADSVFSNAVEGMEDTVKVYPEAGFIDRVLLSSNINYYVLRVGFYHAVSSKC